MTPVALNAQDDDILLASKTVMYDNAYGFLFKLLIIITLPHFMRRSILLLDDQEPLKKSLDDNLIPRQ